MEKTMKKVLSLVLALIFIMSCLATLSSCGFFETDEPATPTPPVTEDPATPDAPQEDPEDEIDIIKNGVSMFTIVYPDVCSVDLTEKVSSLQKAIKNATGVEVKSIQASKATNSGARYILLGSTGFEESFTVTDALATNVDAFNITEQGKHIVFAAHFENTLLTAIDYYINNLIKKNYDADTKTLIFDGRSRSGSEPINTTFDMSNIAKYTIVYSTELSGYYDIAISIRDHIASLTGVSLKVRKSSAVIDSPYEILVGRTNRYVSMKSYKNGTPLMEYKVTVDKGCLQLVCGGLYSAKAGVASLCETLLKNGSSTIKAGTPLAGSLVQEKVALTEGTDIRVMTANILAQTSSSIDEGFPISAERSEIFARILVDYTPDFIGVQEADANYATTMAYYFDIIKETYGMEYSSTDTTLNGTPVANYIIYRSDKYTMNYQKAELPSYANTSASLYHSVLSSAMFTSKTNSSLKIGILSAHWHWEQESAVVGVAKQKVDADQMAAEYKALQAKYPTAKIFCTGDFNSHRFKNKYFNEFLAAINGAVASTIADKNGVLTPSFQHYTPKQYIDHIISTSGTFDVLKHAGTNNHSDKLTDHQPVYADIKFIK